MLKSKVMFPRIILKKGKEKSLTRRHPWVFSGAISSIDGTVKEGDIVEVYDFNGVYLATGHYQPSSISVRIFSFTKTEATYQFWVEKFKTAFSLREKLGISRDCNVFRLVNAEGDGLPGLIVDYYNGTFVIQAHSAGMYFKIDLFRDILANLFAREQVLRKSPVQNDTGGILLKSVYNKSRDTLPFKSGIEAKDGFIFGGAFPDNYIVVSEYGWKFMVDIAGGQKTGFFLDQQENRTILKKYARGGKGLDLFCYLGAWSMHLASAGAEVIGVDASERAVTQAQKIAEMNGLTERTCFLKDDVFSFLEKELASTEKKYDFIVLDPPAFVKSSGKIKEAVKAYRELNEMSMRLIKPGGLLATSSCSYHLSKEMFIDMLNAAGKIARRSLRIIEMRSQGPDHPALLSMPETEYLKCAFLIVD